MPNPRRMKMEMKDMQEGVPHVENIQFVEDNLSRVEATILPFDEPFQKGKFRIEISYPDKYPFAPPKVKFLTPIYHPNVNENGTEICLEIISPEKWKPATRTRQVLEAIVTIISAPEVSHPLRADVAELYTKDRAAFAKTKMQVKLATDNLKVFAKSIQCLSKIGEDLYIEGTPTQFELRSVNQSRSAFACVVFQREFFSIFEPPHTSLTSQDTAINDNVGMDTTPDVTRKEEPIIRCKVLNKSCLGAFKSMNALSKTVESCIITLDTIKEEIIFKLKCFYGINKTYHLNMEDCDPLQAVYRVEDRRNIIQGPSHVLSDGISNFQPGFEEVRNPCSITFCLKELKALLSFADYAGELLAMFFDNAGDPLIFKLESRSFYCDFVLATLAPEAEEELLETQMSSQASIRTPLPTHHQRYTPQRSSTHNFSTHQAQSCNDHSPEQPSLQSIPPPQAVLNVSQTTQSQPGMPSVQKPMPSQPAQMASPTVSPKVTRAGLHTTPATDGNRDNMFSDSTSGTAAHRMSIRRTPMTEISTGSSHHPTPTSPDLVDQCSPQQPQVMWQRTPSSQRVLDKDEKDATGTNSSVMPSVGASPDIANRKQTNETSQLHHGHYQANMATTIPGSEDQATLQKTKNTFHDMSTKTPKPSGKKSKFQVMLAGNAPLVLAPDTDEEDDDTESGI